LPPGFTGDYDAALARAKNEKKPVLAIFSGSDWCPPCMALERNFLSKPAFTAAVTNRLVLLFVDRPRDTSYMTEKAKARNPELFRTYAIRGVPTLMFLDEKGTKLADVQRQFDVAPAEWGKSLVQQAAALRKSK
jgi:thioredoxin-related protein